MRSSTTPQANAITALGRFTSYSVSINGSTTTWPVTEFSTDAQMKDTPDQISSLGGVAARQATFKIDHTMVEAITPYQASLVPAALPLPIGATVVISISFWPNILFSMGSPTYTATVFTGNVISLDPIDATSDITVTAQDLSYLLGSNVSLPAAGVANVALLDATQDIYYSPLVVVDLCLRGCGQYLTAPPVLTGANRTNFTVLSIPGVGGMVPDIGGVVQQYLTPGGTFVAKVGRTTGKFTPDIIGSNGAVYSQSINLATLSASPFQLYRIDFWFKTSDTVGAGLLPSIINGNGGGSASGGSCPWLSINDSTGDLGLAAAGVLTLATTGINVCDGAWHHINVEFTRLTSTAMTMKLTVDGTSFTSSQTMTAGQSLFPAGLSGDTGNWFITGGDGGAVALMWFEALEVIFVPLGVTYSNPSDRNGQTAGVTSSMTATSARLQALAPQTGLNAWQTVQSVAAAEGALCWFDEDGKFFYEPRTTWLARRVAASARSFDASSLTDFSMSVSAAGLRKTVSANYTNVTAIASTTASPAYQADSTLTFASGTTTTAIQTSQLFFNPSTPAVGASNVVGNSWYYPVAASRVGDPAANLLTGVTISIVPTATGFNLTVNNPYSGTIAFWNPTNGTIVQGPALVIHGTKIVTADPVLVSYTGNLGATDDLQLDDNPWRRDKPTTAQLVYTVAMDCYNIIPVLSNINVPGDPRLQLGDVITLLDGRANSVIPRASGVQCVVVDIQHSFTGADYRMTLGIRPLGPPTGWLAGVPGRSEAGTTTYASLP